MKKVFEAISKFIHWCMSPFRSREIEEQVIEVFYLDPVKEFFESYIGVMIIGYITYMEQIDDLEGVLISKIITSVDLDGRTIRLSLSKANGTPGGTLILRPSIDGQFSEVKPSSEKTEESRYRIIFYGNDVVEYLDFDGQGTLNYLNR